EVIHRLQLIAITAIVLQQTLLRSCQIDINKTSVIPFDLSNLVPFFNRTPTKILTTEFMVEPFIFRGERETFKRGIGIILTVNVPGFCHHFEVSNFKKRIRHFFESYSLLQKQGADGFLTNRPGQNRLIKVGNKPILTVQTKVQFITPLREIFTDGL